MANTDPVLDCPEQLHYVRERAKEGRRRPRLPHRGGVRGAERGGATDAEALKKAGAVALSDDGCNVDNANLMRDAMIRAKRQELPVLCHCEDTSMVEGRAVNEGSVSRQLWMEAAPPSPRRSWSCGTPCWPRRPGPCAHLSHIHRQGGGYRAPDEEAGDRPHL